MIIEKFVKQKVENSPYRLMDAAMEEADWILCNQFTGTKLFDQQSSHQVSLYPARC
jgi:hypothetical protein